MLQEVVKGTVKRKTVKKKTTHCYYMYIYRTVFVDVHKRNRRQTQGDHGLTRGTGFGPPQDKETAKVRWYYIFRPIAP